MMAEPEDQLEALNAQAEVRLRRVGAERGVRDLCVHLVASENEAPADREAVPMADLVRGGEGVPLPAEGRRFVVSFRRAVMWRVIDEAFEGHHEGAGTLEGAILTDTAVSRFLGMVRAHTYAEVATGRKLHHYRINALDAVIDVAAFEPPTVRAVRPGPA
jgi:hypothetical protein